MYFRLNIEYTCVKKHIKCQNIWNEEVLHKPHIYITMIFVTVSSNNRRS